MELAVAVGVFSEAVAQFVDVAGGDVLLGGGAVEVVVINEVVWRS